MKILFVRDADINLNLYVLSEIELVHELIKRGVDASIILQSKNGKEQKSIYTMKIPFNKYRYYLIKLFFYLNYFVIKNKVKYILVDLQSVPATLFLVMIKKILGLKLILDTRSVPVEQKILLFKHKFSSFVARNFYDGATYITEATKVQCEKEFGHRFTKTEIFSSGANLELFSKDTPVNVNEEFIHKLKDRFVMIYHGSVTTQRGLPMLLHAIDNLKSEIPEMLFLSISNNNIFLEEYIKQHHLQIHDNILFMDSVRFNEIPQYIKLSTIGVIPYSRIHWWEISSPIKLLEFMSMEIPILLSDIKAHTDVLSRDSKFAVYFNPDIKNDITEKLYYSFKNIETLKSNAHLGREIVAANYTWKTHAEKVERYLLNLNSN